MTEILLLAGRLLFGGLFVYNGVNHFRNLMMLSLPRPWLYSL